MDNLIQPVLTFFAIVGLIAAVAAYRLRRSSDPFKSTARLHVVATVIVLAAIVIWGELRTDEDVAGAMIVAALAGLPVYLGLWYEKGRRAGTLPRWLIPDFRAQAPRIMLVAYLAGTWYITAARIVDAGGFFRHEASLLLLAFAPITLLVGPWAVLANGDGILPLVLTYGVFGVWYAGRQFVTALKARP